MRYLKLQTTITSLLQDESGANAVKYAVIMALVADFVISAVILMAAGTDDLFNAMAACLSGATCSTPLF